MSMIETFKDKILSAKKIAVLSHVIPDADAFGSAIAFQKVLKKFTTANVDIFIEGNEVAELYKPLVGETMLNPVPAVPYDIAIAVDCSAIARMGHFVDVFASAAFKVNIDHHQSNQGFGDINIVEGTRSSTCECLYYLFKDMEIEIPKEVFGLIFSGIITDTVSFSQGGIKPETLNVINEIIAKGIDTDGIRAHFFKNITKAKAQLVSRAIGGIEYFFKDRCAVMSISQEDLREVGASFEDTLGIIENASNIKNVDFAAMIIEKDKGKFYVSLRSTGDVNVLELAKKNKGGGNNEHMSAFQFEGTLEQLKKILKTEARIQLKLNPAEEEKNPFMVVEDDESYEDDLAIKTDDSFFE